MRHHWRYFFGAACLAGALHTAPAHADDITPALQQVIDGANREGKLQLVWGNHILGGPAGAKEAEKLINAKYGTHISIQFTTGPSGPATRGQLAQELAAGQPAFTDLFPLADGASEKIWTVIDWRTLVPSVPADAMYLGMRGVAIATPVVGITYNSQLIPPDQAPKSLADLLKPEFKGKIATSASIYATQFFGMKELMGEDKALAFQRAFVKQVGGLIRCGEEDRIVSGEFLIFALDCGQYEVAKRKALGQPLGWSLPTEGIVESDWLAGVPLNASHPNAAKLFIAYLLTPEGQDFVYRVQGMDSASLPGSKTSLLLKQFEASGTKMVDADLHEDDPDMKRIQAEMAKILEQ